MKEIKSFFTKNNKLNKGYAKSENISKQNNSFGAEFEHILPPSTLLLEYENMYPGTLGKLINMAQKEQIHRHELELKNLSIIKVSKICALLLGIFLAFTILCLGVTRSYGGLVSLILLIIIFGVANLLKKHESQK